MKTKDMPPDEMEFTGERYTPETVGQIRLEHLHRYALARELVAGKDVLDIASGEGYGSAMLAAVAGNVIGVDISEDAVSHASLRYRKNNLEFRLGSCSDIPLDENSVDFVVCFETIEHHDRHVEMMNEIKRVLRSDGTLVLSSPNKREYSDIPNYSNPYHVKELYKDELEELLHDYFTNVVLSGQRILYGSGMFSDRGVHEYFTFKSEGEALTVNQGLPQSIYDIAIATDSQLPPVCNSIFEQDIRDSDIVWYWSNEVAIRDKQLANLNETVVVERDAAAAERDAAAVERDAAVAERDAAVAERDAAVAERDAAVAERRDAAVAERDAAVAERDAAVAERNDIESTLVQVLNSKSWRFTSLLRSIRGWLSGTK